ncbi:MAG: hypothetical protein WC222_11560 [Parachlamydiales bacterium]|jgi:primase-polymerase (primpol)-like protein
MENYKWKLKGLAKKIDPKEAVTELRRIRDKHEKLTPEVIVEESKNINAVLHNYFDWDNKKAAERWRLDQARHLINNVEIEITCNDQTFTVGVFEIVDDTGYSNIDTFSLSEIDTVRKTVLQDLKYLKKKLDAYTEFRKVGQIISEAIETLNS